ncbi:MAG: O-antigen ligase family protein [Crocinitomicaceae bacterium]
MFDKWLNLPAHLYLKLTALTILTVGVALSNVLMSIGAIWIIANWLIQGDFQEYIKRFKKRPSVWFIVGIFFFLIVSLIWSDDFNYGFKDLRVKLPFIVIPLVLATSEPLKNIHFRFLLYVFLGIMLITSLLNIIHFASIADRQPDIREMSWFISHVRYAVLTNFAWMTAFFLIRKKNALWLNISLVCVALWMIYYLYKSQVINGYMLFILLVAILVFYFIWKIRKKSIRYAILFLFAFFGFSTIWLSQQKWRELNQTVDLDYKDLELYTPNGNPYYHDTLHKQRENGNYVWLYVNQAEMKSEWAKRSEIPYDSLDNKGQPMFGTLMRYLTSKGETKDSMGVAHLKDTEVQSIENGQTSIKNNAGFISRLEAFVVEYNIYQGGGDPNGSSFNQRLEHFKAAVDIIESNWLWGVGVGDVPHTFENAYLEIDSQLLPENRHRSHNQFLTIWVALGIIGILGFLSLFIIPFFEVLDKDFFMIFLLLGLFFSCLFQDFIETQAGVTIFGLFYALAIYREKEQKA